MKFLLSCLLMMLSVTAVSYGRQGRPLQRIHAAKMAYMTDRIQLSDEQATKFIPLYKEYEMELFGIRRTYFKKYNLQNPEDSDDFTTRQYVEDDLDYQQQVIELKRKYNDRFLKVLTAKQLADMYISEREFRQILMRRLKQRQEGGRGR